LRIPLRVAIVAEYYPRTSDPAFGIWAHRQAQAVRARGVEARVVVLDRPVPSRNDLRALPNPGPLAHWASRFVDPHGPTVLDGVPVRYARFFSPPRPWTYPRWGRWAARPLRRALDQGPTPALVHAHYAVPAGDATLRWIRRGHDVPLVVSVHGGDLSYAATRRGGADVVTLVLRAADAVIANSEVTRRGIEELTGPLPRLRVIHPGADPVPAGGERHADPTLVTLAHLEAHKNQAAVIRALAALAGRFPRLRYELIGKGPDQAELEQLATSLGVGDRVVFRGAKAHEEAMSELARCHVHVMPSVHDAFGVAHIEAMAAGLPAIGGVKTGAEDIAGAGEGMVLVPAGDVTAIARAIEGLVGNDAERARVGEAARLTVAEHFTWGRNGAETVAVYEEVVAARAKGKGRHA
jgi:glycosyltransferase involved in cell wall biosynthesis